MRQLRSKNPPPLDRRFLVKNIQYRSVGGGYWKVRGTAWKEAWFNGKEFVLWTGDEKTHTTERCDFEFWAERPEST